MVLWQGGALLRVVAERCGGRPMGGVGGRAERVARTSDPKDRACSTHNLTAAAITAVAEHRSLPWYPTSCFGGGRACALRGVLPAAAALLARRRRHQCARGHCVRGPSWVPGHDLAGQ